MAQPSFNLETLSDNEEPQFLGCCVTPARTFCCGCSLQASLKSFSVIMAVLSVLDLMAFVADLHVAVPSLITIANLVRGSLLIAVSIFLWKSAARLNADLLSHAFFSLGLIFAVDLIGNLALSLISYATIWEDLKRGCEGTLRQEETGPIKSDKEVECRSFANVAVAVLCVVVAVSLILEACILLLVAYIIWSFGVRVKRRELFLVSAGLTPSDATLLPSRYTPDPTPYQMQPEEYTRNLYPNNDLSVRAVSANSSSAQNQQQPSRPDVELSETAPRRQEEIATSLTVNPLNTLTPLKNDFN